MSVLPEQESHHTLKGTVVGTLTALLVSLDLGDLIKTAIMAATGAAVSFGMSVLLKWLKDKLK